MQPTWDGDVQGTQAALPRSSAIAQCWAGCTWQSSAECRNNTSNTHQSGILAHRTETMPGVCRWCLIKLSALQRLPISLGISASKKDSRWKLNMPRKSWTLGRHSQAGICGITALLPALFMLDCQNLREVCQRLKHRSDCSASHNLTNVMAGTIERGVLPSTVLSCKWK